MSRLVSSWLFYHFSQVIVEIIKSRHLNITHCLEWAKSQIKKPVYIIYKSMSGMHIQLTTSYRYRILIFILLLTDSYLMFLLSFNKLLYFWSRYKKQNKSSPKEEHGKNTKCSRWLHLTPDIYVVYGKLYKIMQIVSRRRGWKEGRTNTQAKVCINHTLQKN